MFGHQLERPILLMTRRTLNRRKVSYGYGVGHIVKYQIKLSLLSYHDPIFPSNCHDLRVSI